MSTVSYRVFERGTRPKLYPVTLIPLNMRASAGERDARNRTHNSAQQGRMRRHVFAKLKFANLANFNARQNNRLYGMVKLDRA